MPLARRLLVEVNGRSPEERDAEDFTTNNKLLFLAAGLGTAWLARAAIRRWRYLDLRGRTVLVTGGSRGLGLVMARELVTRGAKVAICARDHDDLNRARQDLLQRGGTVFTVPCDVTDTVQVDLFPGLAAEIASLVNGLLLPGPGGIGTQAAKGKDSHSAVSPSWLTQLGDDAAVRNNELQEARVEAIA